MSPNTQKGFTLIELLVVIAIIGILAAVVIGSLGSAKNRGQDAKIKSNLSSLRTQAELYYTLNGHYGDDFAAADCPSSGTTLFYGDATARNMISQSNTYGNLTCASDDGSAGSGSAARTWAVSAPLSDAATWCVDNTGFAGSGTAAIASNNASCQ